MLEQENKQIVTKLYLEGWGKGNLAAFDLAWAPNHVLVWNEQRQNRQQRTVSELKSIVQAYRAAFPDLRVLINEMVAEADKVAVQVTFEGTHRGVYEGFQPTNKISHFTDMQILKLKNGKITEATLGSGGLRYFFGILNGSVLED